MIPNFTQEELKEIFLLANSRFALLGGYFDLLGEKSRVDREVLCLKGLLEKIEPALDEKFL